MGKNKSSKQTPTEIAAAPGFFGHVLKPGQSLVWDNEVEDFALQLTTAALGPTVTPGRSTLIAEAKDAKIALCTLVPEKTEQWNMTHLFTPYDGPVVFHNEGVNEIHLTGLVDVQDDDEEDHDGCDSDHEEGMMMDGTYSDSDDDEEAMVFGADDDEDDSEDDSDDDEEEEGRFEVIEERVHGDVGEKKKQKETSKKEATKKEAKKETTPVTKEATPTKETKKETTPAKKEKEAKREASLAKADVAAKKDKKSVAEKVADATGANKKRPAPADAVEVPKKAKTTRVYKGVTIEDIAVGKGQPVAHGKKVSILYRGRLSNGKQFDAQQNRKTPFVFRHGIGDVIKGMDIGIEGMRAGGKRTITIPSHLGYGKKGAPPTIPGNSTLVFEIELL